MTTLSYQTLYGKGITTPGRLRVGIQEDETELPHREMVSLLRWYYEGNGLYDRMRAAGYVLGDSRLRSIRNPAYRVVEFYASTVWSGPLSKALPIVPDPGSSPLLVDAISRLWSWSNWSAEKGLHVRTAAIAGDSYLKIATSDAPGGQRVYIQRLDPEYVTSTVLDERGYITSCRIDVPRTRRTSSGSLERYTHSEVWVGPRATVYHHKGSAETPTSSLSSPVDEIDLSQIIDFVPIVRSPHLYLGGEHGVGAFTLQLEKVDEINRQASRLSSVLFRHNGVTWALEANSIDAATGRPLPAPRIGSTALNSAEEVEIGSERMLSLPGNSRLVPLVPPIDYGAALDVLHSQIGEIEADLPELSWYKIKDHADPSGEAVRALMVPAILKAEEVRGNHDEALVRAHKMALTIGEAIGAWERVGLGRFGPEAYERGLLEHEIGDRPILPSSRKEEAETISSETSAGLPLTMVLRRSGWSDEEIDRVVEERSEERRREMTSVSAAMLDLESGSRSNGLER